MTPCPHIHGVLDAGVLRIAIDRPAKKNALTIAMYAALAALLLRAARDDAVRVVLIEGAATVFTSGNDLHDFIEHPPENFEAPVFQFLRTLAHLGKPVLAAVTGDAIGIGTTLLLHCDHVVAGRSARFALPFVKLGLCPEAASSLLLPQLIGYQRAAEMLLFGEPIAATQALDWGLVQRVVDDADTFAAARERAARLAALAPAALAATKALLRRHAWSAVDAAMRDEAVLFDPLLRGADTRALLAAFLNRNPLQERPR